MKSIACPSKASFPSKNILPFGRGKGAKGKGAKGKRGGPVEKRKKGRGEGERETQAYWLEHAHRANPFVGLSARKEGRKTQGAQKKRRKNEARVEVCKVGFESFRGFSSQCTGHSAINHPGQHSLTV